MVGPDAKDAVKPAEDRQGQADLRLLAGIPLQIAADHQVEKLLRAAEFHVGPHVDGIVALH